MGKKMMIVYMNNRRNTYKMFIKDIKKVYEREIKIRPPLPLYHDPKHDELQTNYSPSSQ